MSERIAQLDVRRRAPTVIVGLLVGFALLYIIVLATPSTDIGGNWRTTTFGSAIDDWQSFTRTLLNGLTFAALLFIVASGFSLIFGLMRVVNMAYGSLYLIGGYVAYEVQQKMTGSGFTIPGIEVSTWEWVLPAMVAAGVVGLIGLFVQQVFLSWNQGQELRQALITIAISVIIADQIIAHFNKGLASTVTWPGWSNRLVELPLLGVDYSLARLVMLFLGVAVGFALWVWLYRTRTGLVIRAGVDDLQMTSALGVNIKRTLALAFVVGSALAAFGGVVGASQGAVAPGQDGQWLLNSLVVVIIGGMGSLLGAAVGSLLYGLTFSFSAVYLPTIGDNCCTQYSIVFTFILLALVLAFRPQGLFGKFT
ncbi:MAG: branched-chain amino acid ABC transporter permease [Thermoleophilia bacterium]|nr:branched-chain amino acid ABC transporter permease [Thermoleophilia bacterium]